MKRRITKERLLLPQKQLLRLQVDLIDVVHGVDIHY